MMRLLALLLVASSGMLLREGTEANPIRRIVNMLQKMQEEIEAEGKKEKKNYEKFYCFCQNGNKKLAQEIADGMAEVKELMQEIEQKTARKEQLDQEVDQHRKDREEAKAAIEKAEAIRAKEKEEYEKATADFRQNLDACNKAVEVLSRGMGQKAFLQVPANVAHLKNAVQQSRVVMDMEREEVLSFLSSPFGDYQSSSGEIVGIIKAMVDEMDKDLGGAISAEEAAVKAHEELMEAKRQIIAEATANIEKKVVRSGELAVEITEAKNEAGNTGKEIEANREFVANLEKSCADKKKEFEVRNAERAEELKAISEAIKVLNDDDALDIFKKTLPSPAAVGAVSFIQRDLAPAQEAAAYVNSALAITQQHKPQLSMLAFMLRAGKVDFSKVIKMIDDMIKHLGQEQKDDDDMLNYCNTELNANGDKAVTLARDIDDLNKAVDALKARMEQLQAEIEMLTQRIADTEQMMKDATAQRKEENELFVQTQGLNTAAVQLVTKAKNRLYKFYNPALYKPPPQRELTEEERIAQNMGEVLPTEAPQYIAGTKITVNMQLRTDPGPPPETWEKGYKRKGEKSQGVIGLMDMCLKDLEKEIKQNELDEATAQKDYEKTMSDGKASVEADTAAKTGDETALAQANTDHQQAVADRGAKNDELTDTKNVIANLHTECDFLIENHAFRKDARLNEVEALKNAKAVLHGADYS
jgi:chromosome segregation ATPase